MSACVAFVAERLESRFGQPLSEIERGRLRKAMPELKLRPKTIGRARRQCPFSGRAAADPARRRRRRSC